MMAMVTKNGRQSCSDYRLLSHGWIATSKDYSDMYDKQPMAYSPSMTPRKG
jgi:hypothetical protein